ncbi:hypothetical protein DFR43_101224 [Tepidicella xavieri]|uniref:PIN domain-containing protein n=2 Tax=Tepidicella xavieri TaxID=360241 RepID=A0A4R6UEZ2_9BURK|nr:hypothetical protein DFR43_101224 [Tepidicella xavieri]
MEYEAVCSRMEHLEAAGLHPEDLPVFLDALAYLIRPIHIHYLWRPQLRDLADELVLEAAINAGAHALITFNRKHFEAAAARFSLPVMTPGAFLRSLQ